SSSYSTTNSTGPTLRRSPGRTLCRSETGSPFSQVPLTLPRSSMVRKPSTSSRRQCSRLTEAEGIRSPAPFLRPVSLSGERTRDVCPLPAPRSTTSRTSIMPFQKRGTMNVNEERQRGLCRSSFHVHRFAFSGLRSAGARDDRADDGFELCARHHAEHGIKVQTHIAAIAIDGRLSREVDVVVDERRNAVLRRTPSGGLVLRPQLLDRHPFVAAAE